MATSEDIDVATREDFFMATDSDRPFLRIFCMVFIRPQPDGLIQLRWPRHLGATALVGLASWLCPSLLKRPPGSGSGSRRLAARSRPG